ncbi:MAG: crossover junction endodeoxyribonuclease RuvC [Dehalococcoidia bacterium]|jgi:crossover junction endodeoxyribonuclease RuvC|nr:crossover junction endodeoxyribonuclease RuvC [Dehalococcoidia bacterium]|tara:strand:- start:796 stop:1287 length:492 start_codon:yes stop_codon:yes gene_type:complete
MIILGVDPSLSNTGYGILESVESKLKPIEGGVIKTRSSDPLSLRLSIISQEFDKIIEKFLPDHIAVEDLHSRPKFAKTSILMGHARGVILSSAGIKKIQVFDYQPTQAKNIVTGSGRADKKQVMLSVSKILNNQNLLKNEHVADAFSIAICHSIINNSKTKII